MISSDMLLGFVPVAQTLIVERSAIELNVVKSVISKRIGQLERDLGVTLFSRSTRRVALTAAGEAYLAQYKIRRNLYEKDADVICHNGHAARAR